MYVYDRVLYIIEKMFVTVKTNVIFHKKGKERYDKKKVSKKTKDKLFLDFWFFNFSIW